MTIIDRFLRYVSYPTQSDETCDTFPSTSGQLKLAEKLVKELKEIGLDDALVDDNGYVYATLKGNIKDAKKIGFIAHMDTAPDMTGEGVNPQVIENYDGQDIRLNSEYTTKAAEFPFLKDLKGHTIITTDGTTLLGADDKAGIAIIMSAMEKIKNSNINHPDIKVAFTPDEEIGRGADRFDVAGFGADFAFTMDGGGIAELEYENFNGADAKVTIHGKGVHPGTAKNIMINSSLVAMELNQMLPAEQRPEYTQDYEGFYMLSSIKGNIEKTQMDYIIRDHSRELFEKKKEVFSSAVDFLNKKYGDIIECKIEDRYYNMRQIIEKNMYIVDLASKSMKDIGLTPDIKPIRGGTDGSRLSFMGLPTPNLFTGGYNYHGRYELVSVDYMKKAVELIIKIVENSTKEKI